MKIDDLMLLTKVDIPFPEGRLLIHKPTVEEISLITEEDFFTACRLLNFSKDILNEEDKLALANKSNFEILMSMMNGKDINLRKQKACAMLLLSLMFPDYKIELTLKEIVFEKYQNEELLESGFINSNNFESFKVIFRKMFCLKEDASDFNPKGDLARRIADKLRERQKKLAEKQKDVKINILSRYMSILAVGLRLDINTVSQYTVYQLFDQFERLILLRDEDLTIELKMNGAKDVEDVDSWLKDIH